MNEGQRMTFQLKISASDGVQRALETLGRTEDVTFSPDGRRLAIAGYHRNKILVVATAIAGTAADRRVVLSGCMTITSPGLASPHGLCFLDDETLAVACREGALTILRLPRMRGGESSFVLAPVRTLATDHLHLLRTPGSVTSTRIGLDLYELLICNNYASQVTRHILDAREQFRPLRNEVLLSAGLKIPDGITVNPDRRWLAVSNHETREVLMFRNRADLDRSTGPDGALAGVACPHGLRFTADDRFVIVADAGAPHVHVYARDGRDWSGDRAPVASIRVMDDRTYRRGRHNPQEGGPKGVDVDRGMRVLVTTCAEQKLACFDLERVLRELGPDQDRPEASALAADPAISRDERHFREVLVRELRQLASIDARLAQQRAALEAEHARAVQAIYRTRSWRVTAPLRGLYSMARALKRARDRHA